MGRSRKENFISESKEDATYQKVLDGRDINRYQRTWRHLFVRYGDWLHRKRDQRYFLEPKIMIRQIGNVPIATLDEDGFYTLNTIYNVRNVSQYALAYLLAIINSKLGRWFWSAMNSDYKTLFPKIKKTQIESIPIHSLDLPSSKGAAKHNAVTELANRMLRLHVDSVSAKTEHDKKTLARQIAATDGQLDHLLYELYDLTPEEAALVERSFESADVDHVEAP